MCHQAHLYRGSDNRHHSSCLCRGRNIEQFQGTSGHNSAISSCWHLERQGHERPEQHSDARYENMCLVVGLLVWCLVSFSLKWSFSGSFFSVCVMFANSCVPQCLCMCTFLFVVLTALCLLAPQYCPHLRCCRASTVRVHCPRIMRIWLSR